MFVCVLQARDPIPQFRKYALEAGLMTEADVKELEKSVNEEVEEAVKFADESPKPVGSFLLYALHHCMWMHGVFIVDADITFWLASTYHCLSSSFYLSLPSCCHP